MTKVTYGKENSSSYLWFWRDKRLSLPGSMAASMADGSEAESLHLELQGGSRDCQLATVWFLNLKALPK